MSSTEEDLSSTEEDSAYSLSDFLKDFPNKLFWEPSLDGRLYVFSGRDDDDELEPTSKLPLPHCYLTCTLASFFPPTPETLSNQWPTKAAMKDFLAKLNFNIPVLVQFWTAKSKRRNWVLTTSDQPYGVNNFHKGLASYRSHCVDNNYVISENEEVENIGPHVRAFRDICLEYSPNVGHYSVKDYPQLQYTISCGVRGLLALPVFRDVGGPCIGVLEIVTTSNKLINYCDLWHVCSKLKDAGLEYPNMNCGCYEDICCDFSEALDEVCKALQIPFAQTWIPCQCWASGGSERKSYTSFAGDDSGYMLTTVEAPCSMAARNLDSFRKIIELHCIRKGKGVVGRAFSSQNACFCKDITKLSIIEYPLAHHAYDVGLTSSFAISLRSSYAGDIVYILEFFLPPVKIDGEDPWIFLDTLLGTMKQHFHDFRVASGEELGGKLSIEVIKLSMDDKLNSFETCQTTRSPPRLEAIRDGEEKMQLDSPYQQLTKEFSTNSGRNVVSAEQRDSSCRKSMSEVDATNCGRNVVSVEHRAISYLSTVLAVQNGRQIVQQDSSYQKNMAEIDATNNEKKIASADQSDIADIPLDKRDPAEGSPAEGSDREGEISREELEKLFGTDIENAARTLGVSRSTFKRKCRQRGIKRWPVPKRNRVTRSPSQLESMRGGNKQTGESSRRDCLPCDKAPKQATTSIASTMLLASAKQNESSVTIKATYGDDIIKFQLSFSSGMVELQEKVAKKLNLKAGSFKIKYADEDEDDDWILLPDDEALQDCINSCRSSDRTTIKMLVLPIIN